MCLELVGCRSTHICQGTRETNLARLFLGLLYAIYHRSLSEAVHVIGPVIFFCVSCSYVHRRQTHATGLIHEEACNATIPTNAVNKNLYAVERDLVTLLEEELK